MSSGSLSNESVLFLHSFFPPLNELYLVHIVNKINISHIAESLQTMLKNRLPKLTSPRSGTKDAVTQLPQFSTFPHTLRTERASTNLIFTVPRRPLAPCSGHLYFIKIITTQRPT